MKSLIESGIQWETIGDYEKSAFHYEVDRAAIQKETGILSIYMTLDFIMPYQDMERLSAQLIHKLAGIHGVKFHFHYDNVILRSMDIVRLFIPHMIDIVNGEYTAITKTIQTDNFQYQDGRLDIYALGKFSTEQLNQQVAKLFENLLRDTFSIETKVIFHNNEESARQRRQPNSVRPWAAALLPQIRRQGILALALAAARAVRAETVVRLVEKGAGSERRKNFLQKETESWATTLWGMPMYL